MIRMLTLAALAATMLAGGAQAAEYDVKALNFGKAGMMVMEPSLLRIAPGDTVHFLATDKGHDFETIPGMLPDGATPFRGKINEGITVTFDKPGVYGIRCVPHYPMGMVAMIVVGNPVNEDTAKAVAQPGKAKTVFAKLFETFDSQTTAAK